MTARDHRDALVDMLFHARLATGLVQGLSTTDLNTDHRSRLAIERALEILGEAAGKLPETVRAKYPDLPWARMTALRNRLAHAYFAVDHAVLHRIASELLPPLLSRLAEIVSLEGADQPPRDA